MELGALLGREDRRELEDRVVVVLRRTLEPLHQNLGVGV